MQWIFLTLSRTRPRRLLRLSQLPIADARVYSGVMTWTGTSKHCINVSMSFLRWCFSVSHCWLIQLLLIIITKVVIKIWFVFNTLLLNLIKFVSQRTDPLWECVPIGRICHFTHRRVCKITLCTLATASV